MLKGLGVSEQRPSGRLPELATGTTTPLLPHDLLQLVSGPGPKGQLLNSTNGPSPS